MEMPQLTDAHRKLQMLAGTWVGDEHMHPSPWDPKGGPAVGRVQNRVALDGFVVVHDYEQERHGRVTYRSHGVFHWDAGRRCYLLHWFDTMGSQPSEFQGQFQDNVLTLTNKSAHGHSRVVWNFTGDGSYTFHMDVSPDGQQWKRFVDGTYKRQAGGA